MLDTEKYPVLSKVEFPKDIRELDILQLKQLCTDIREYLIDTISEIGGHFGRILERTGKESCGPREGTRPGLIGPDGIGQAAAASEGKVISNQDAVGGGTDPEPDAITLGQ